MPKRTDLKKLLVIGSGPIVIGQAAEFDYAGTQACLALNGYTCKQKKSVRCPLSGKEYVLCAPIL